MNSHLRLFAALVAAASLASFAQAGNRIIPYLIQTPEFSTWIKIINLCSEPSSYQLYFIGSDGERKNSPSPAVNCGAGFTTTRYLPERPMFSPFLNPKMKSARAMARSLKTAMVALSSRSTTGNRSRTGSQNGLRPFPGSSPAQAWQWLSTFRTLATRVFPSPAMALV